MKGTITKKSAHFGFIRGEAGGYHYFSHRDLEIEQDWDELDEGVQVSFDPYKTCRGHAARQVKILVEYEGGKIAKKPLFLMDGDAPPREDIRFTTNHLVDLKGPWKDSPGDAEQSFADKVKQAGGNCCLNMNLESRESGLPFLRKIQYRYAGLAGIYFNARNTTDLHKAIYQIQMIGRTAELVEKKLTKKGFWR